MSLAHILAGIVLVGLPALGFGVVHTVLMLNRAPGYERPWYPAVSLSWDPATYDEIGQRWLPSYRRLMVALCLGAFAFVLVLLFVP